MLHLRKEETDMKIEMTEKVALTALTLLSSGLAYVVAQLWG